jgi:GNAT superfamily N-acetyltransferase
MKVVPASPERWSDIEALFGEKGGYAGCWCMFWRLPRKEFKQKKGAGTKREHKKQLDHAVVTGVIGYEDGNPVGWCSIGPREAYAALEDSRILKRVDDTPVWSVVCYFVAKQYRKRDAMSHLLQGAVAFARKQGAVAVEGYPLDMDSQQLKGQNLNSYAGYMGIASVYKKLGFKQVGRASETQLIMRLVL